MQDSHLSLHGKTVLITGGARRIGAGIADILHAEGMNIILHYRNSRQDAESLAAQLESRRPQSTALVQGDLLNVSEFPRIIDTACLQWGHLDVLINNASTFYPTELPHINEQQWDELIGVNLKAPLFLIQQAAKTLKENRGCIINIVDIHGDRPLKRHPVYSVAKAGLIMLTKAMARELAPHVRVNGIAPGAILWPEAEQDKSVQQKIIDRTALKRLGHPHDIALAARFLIRDAGYITGQILPVEGGRTLSN